MSQYNYEVSTSGIDEAEQFLIRGNSSPILY